MKIYPDNEPCYSETDDSKLMLIQIGKTFYSIKPYLKVKGAKDINQILDDYDVRLLKEKE